MSTWPKKLKLNLQYHCEDLWDDGRRLGLSGAALDHFSAASYELGVDLEVRADGTAYVVAFAGVRLPERVEV